MNITNQGFGRLLVSLIIYIVVSPFIPAGTVASAGMHLWLTVVLIFAALQAAGKSKKSAAIIWLVPALVLHWLGEYISIPYVRECGLALLVGFYAFVLVAFIKQLLHSKKINGEVIAGSLCIYLIIGLLWGSAYNLTFAIDPTAFNGNLVELEGVSKVHVFNYFSLVTLTSLGYGDITPQSLGAASLCQMEAIIGQFYTAVLVAWLVGMYGKPMGKKNQPVSDGTDNKE